MSNILGLMLDKNVLWLNYWKYTMKYIKPSLFMLDSPCFGCSQGIIGFAIGLAAMV